MSTTPLGNALIAELLTDPERFKQEGRAYRLLEECFSGMPVATLRPLLRHDIALVRHAALFVASELGTQASELLDDVIALTTSGDRYECYHALEIVAVCAIDSQADDFFAVPAAMMSNDVVIQGLAMRLMARSDLSQLMAALTVVEGGVVHADEHRRGLNLLVSGERANPDEIKRMLSSESQLARCYGVIAAKRLHDINPTLWETAATMPSAIALL